MPFITLQRTREYLALALLGLVPFHALLVTILTKIIAGPGHAPLGWLALWKEGLLGLILIIAVVEFLSDTKKKWEIDIVDGLIVALMVLSIIPIIFNYQFSIINYFYGFKYDFIPLIAFLILRRVPWSDWFRSMAVRVILIVGSIVAVYGILTLFLPDSFFQMLGYSDAHSLYFADRPLAAFQQIAESGVRRIQSTFAGPNQLGLWLLIPLSIATVLIVRKKVFRFSPVLSRVEGFFVFGSVIVLLMTALFFSFSRSAWIGAFVMIVVFLSFVVEKKLFRKFLGMLVTLGVVAGIVGVLILPKVFFRLSSSRGHWERPVQAFQTMMAHPLGLGLGSAGPATNRTSETCVFLRPIDDPSWAKVTPDLCVFLGDRQVQPDPSIHSCKCPFLPENWYLQIGVELGVLGLILYMLLVLFVIRYLLLVTGSMNEKPVTRNQKPAVILQNAALFGFIGISIAAVFLHAWEDVAVAYTGWITLAAALAPRKPDREVA